MCGRRTYCATIHELLHRNVKEHCVEPIAHLQRNHTTENKNPSNRKAITVALLKPVGDTVLRALTTALFRWGKIRFCVQERIYPKISNRRIFLRGPRSHVARHLVRFPTLSTINHRDAGVNEQLKCQKNWLKINEGKRGVRGVHEKNAGHLDAFCEK